MTEDPAFEDAVRDLADTLEELRSELAAPPSGPLGLPRPPTPGEVLRLTEQYTIPALVALLEANVRLLELLAAVIRVADGRPLDVAAREEGLLDLGRRRVGDAGRAGAGGLAAASRRTLERLDDTLAELQDAAAGGTPDDPEVQRLLSEARALRAEVDDRLAEADSTSDTGEARDEEADAEPGGHDGGQGAEPGNSGPVEVDVEEELNTLRRQADRPVGDPDADAGGDGDEDDQGDSGAP